MEQAPGVATASGRGVVSAADLPLLLVEDDEILRRFLVELLEREGFEVVAAGSGERALRLLTRLEPAVILLDGNISSPSSTEFLRRLRRLAGRRPPILCLIMPGQSSLRRNNRALGVTEYLSEPFEPAELVGTVQCLAEKGAVD